MYGVEPTTKYCFGIPRKEQTYRTPGTSLAPINTPILSRHPRKTYRLNKRPKKQNPHQVYGHSKEQSCKPDTH
ncbi:hypothetical protein ZS60_22390 [Salmonella enterica subsp. enterica serovar Enteritidis]|nr:hypothetical protein [Salmonella enterica subsp. enterica serovar Enteritidis]